ncbi:Inner membrane lipoprotein YiaD precursor [Fusobacterium necrogenes]|uniref:Inner membrane lipoprotein YiaD n=1 Tax=Fusobacterium necrogenes TaxID=858 RepID=A0A377GZ88_9FUSO|nr:OmpA family protein [Fusobacterium necrogenes]STO32299.1 Inner membrane lipoprotein YiaD precursor [Fusobacterium necrogenes]
MRNTKKIIASLILGVTIVGCTSSPFLDETGSVNKKTSGTAGGAAAGALIGQLIGKDTKGTLIGAGIGALAGLGWGAYRDNQEQELRERLKNTEVEVNREGDNLNLYLPGGVTFATNSANIASNFYDPLNSIATVLVQYPETRIIVNGYTDNTGAASYNLDLSQRRANSVRDYFISQGVASYRVTAVGHGINNPRATNNTAAGRAENRRVEIQILPLN